MKHLLRITCCCLLAASAAFVTSCKDDDPKPDDGNGKGDRIEFTAMHALGARTEHATDEDASGFRIVMSENEATGTADKPVFSAGKYATVVLYGSENVKYTLPAGTYPLVDGKPAAGKGELAASSYGTADAGMGSERLLSGSVTVTHTEAGYKIELTAELTENRTLNCVYEGAIDFGKEQENPDPVYDVDLAAKYALGVVYSEVAEDGSSDFYLLLSDVEIAGDAEEPEVFGAGQIAILDFCAIEREEGMLPEGTYLFTIEEPSDMMGVLDYSGYATTDESGEPTSEEPISFSECTATVSYTDDGYQIEVLATLEDGRSFHGSYEGMIDFEQGGGDITLPGLEGDVNTTFSISEASYFGLTERGTAQFKIDLYDNDFEQNPVTTNRLTLMLFTAETDDPLRIAPGRYTVNTSGAAGTLSPGSLDMNTFMIEGSYCEQTLVTTEPEFDYELLYGMIASGTVDITVDGGQYVITAALVDKDGNSIRGTYTGQITIDDKSYYSNLEGDKQADLAGTPCLINYFGDYYGIGGDNWIIFAGSEEDGSEEFQIELLSPASGFAAGLPEGEYPVTPLGDYRTGGHACVPGVFENPYMVSSWYLGNFMDGIIYSAAPFKRGKVTIDRAGDQYTIAVDIYDDAPEPNRVTGTWTGTPTIRDESGSQPAPQIESRKRASAKATAKNGSVHDRVAAHAVKVQPTAPKSPRW